MQHLDEGTIHAWLDGALDAEDAARVEEHVAACATCAAAVAEARGLAAGASRILASLDNVPGGVIPRVGTDADATPITSRKPRSLWKALHLTPGRAAAAAVVFLAAGTALVLRQKPNEPLADRAFVFVSSDTGRHKPVVGTSMSAKAPAAVMPPAPIPVVTAPAVKSETRHDNAKVASARPEARAADNVAIAASPRLTTSAADTNAVATAAPSPSAADAAKSLTGAVAGAASARVAPMRASAKMALAQVSVTGGSAAVPVGCYAVEGDSLPMLPRRIMLERQAIRGIVGDSIAPVSAWRWSPRQGGVRLEMATPSAAAAQLDSTATSGDLRGSITLNGRQIALLLRHVDCPTTR